MKRRRVYYATVVSMRQLEEYTHRGLQVVCNDQDRLTNYAEVTINAHLTGFGCTWLENGVFRTNVVFSDVKTSRQKEADAIVKANLMKVPELYYLYAEKGPMYFVKILYDLKLCQHGVKVPVIPNNLLITMSFDRPFLSEAYSRENSLPGFLTKQQEMFSEMGRFQLAKGRLPQILMVAGDSPRDIDFTTYVVCFKLLFWTGLLFPGIFTEQRDLFYMFFADRYPELRILVSKISYHLMAVINVVVAELDKMVAGSVDIKGGVLNVVTFLAMKHIEFAHSKLGGDFEVEFADTFTRAMYREKHNLLMLEGPAKSTGKRLEPDSLDRTVMRAVSGDASALKGVMGIVKGAMNASDTAMESMVDLLTAAENKFEESKREEPGPSQKPDSKIYQDEDAQVEGEKIEEVPDVGDFASSLIPEEEKEKEKAKLEESMEEVTKLMAAARSSLLSIGSGEAKLQEGFGERSFERGNLNVTPSLPSERHSNLVKLSAACASLKERKSEDIERIESNLDLPVVFTADRDAIHTDPEKEAAPVSEEHRKYQERVRAQVEAGVKRAYLATVDFLKKFSRQHSEPQQSTEIGWHDKEGPIGDVLFPELISRERDFGAKPNSEFVDEAINAMQATMRNQDLPEEVKDEMEHMKDRADASSVLPDLLIDTAVPPVPLSQEEISLQLLASQGDLKLWIGDELYDCQRVVNLCLQATDPGTLGLCTYLLSYLDYRTESTGIKVVYVPGRGVPIYKTGIEDLVLDRPRLRGFMKTMFIDDTLTDFECDRDDYKHKWDIPNHSYLLPYDDSSLDLFQPLPLAVYNSVRVVLGLRDMYDETILNAEIEEVLRALDINVDFDSNLPFFPFATLIEIKGKLEGSISQIGWINFQLAIQTFILKIVKRVCNLSNDLKNAWVVSSSPWFNAHEILIPRLFKIARAFDFAGLCEDMLRFHYAANRVERESKAGIFIEPLELQDKKAREKAAKNYMRSKYVFSITKANITSRLLGPYFDILERPTWKKYVDTFLKIFPDSFNTEQLAFLLYGKHILGRDSVSLLQDLYLPEASYIHTEGRYVFSSGAAYSYDPNGLSTRVDELLTNIRLLDGNKIQWSGVSATASVNPNIYYRIKTLRILDRSNEVNVQIPTATELAYDYIYLPGLVGSDSTEVMVPTFDECILAYVYEDIDNWRIFAFVLPDLDDKLDEYRNIFTFLRPRPLERELPTVARGSMRPYVQTASFDLGTFTEMISFKYTYGVSFKQVLMTLSRILNLPFDLVLKYAIDREGLTIDSMISDLRNRAIEIRRIGRLDVLRYHILDGVFYLSRTTPRGEVFS